MPEHSIVVVTHNIMRTDAGYPLDFVAHYRELQEELGRPIDILFLQENRIYPLTQTWPADHIAALLGARGQYRAFFDRGGVLHTPSGIEDIQPTFPDPVIIWNTERLHATQWLLAPIPRVYRYDWMGRRFATDTPVQRLIAAMQFLLKDEGLVFGAASIHLDTWNGNGHKRRQLLAAADAVRNRFRDEKIIIAGDTNIFGPLYLPIKRLQRAELRRILRDAGIGDPQTEQTHHLTRIPGFSESHKRLIRIAERAEAKLDIVASDMRSIDHGVVETLESDHDLVWSILDLA